ncbi:MAG: hypothetical protein BYD32DRAFT_490079 [Podila humilis]|nr:MAG: hypothetical protein BYD32DRAFT_490079 [Podila humilis]
MTPDCNSFGAKHYEPRPAGSGYRPDTAVPRVSAPLELPRHRKPKVLIVGAGIGGITLGVLLHKANIPFIIFEKNTETKPTGAAISIGSTLLPLFQQLGIQKEFEAIGKPNAKLHLYNEQLSPVFTADFTPRESITGAVERIVAKPDLYDLLRRQIPQENILMSKKILRRWGTLRDPSAPTEALDQEEFPQLKLPQSQSAVIVGHTTSYKIVIQFLTKETAKLNDSFRNSECGPEAAEAMCHVVRTFPVPLEREGNAGTPVTLGDLIDKTSKEQISKVMLEEKVFNTWFGRRTVLLGNACHKLNPSRGLGAVTSIHDAAALANWIHSLHSYSVPALEGIFKEYQAERHPVAKAMFTSSNFFGKAGGKSLKSKLIEMFLTRGGSGPSTRSACTKRSRFCIKDKHALLDDDAAFASGILEVTDKEIAAAWTIEIGDNAAARSQRKAGCTLLVKGFSGIDGAGDKSNTHEGDEEQLAGKHLEVQEFGLLRRM